jgi:4-hydroxythreonine-4-phosphate dehydrogenase
MNQIPSMSQILDPDDALPTVAITMGDPGGVGPEIIAKALADPSLRIKANFLIFGNPAPMDEAARLAQMRPFWHEDPGIEFAEAEALEGLSVRGDSPINGAASYHWFDRAIARARVRETDETKPPPFNRVIDAIVTAPISKRAWHMAGHTGFAGHTDMLADRFGTPKVTMVFHAPAKGEQRELNVALATVHIPLSRVATELTREKVVQACEHVCEMLRALGNDSPRVGIAGLNPHAGEGGLMGDEEQRVVTPAIEALRARGIAAEGPYAGDTIFNRVQTGALDAVVAMYHDQGLIPVKLLAWDRAVNLTMGLPIVRTSPDHGTAFDIAGQNRANEGSMRAAIALALRMLVRRG